MNFESSYDYFPLIEDVESFFENSFPNNIENNSQTNKEEDSFSKLKDIKTEKEQYSKTEPDLNQSMQKILPNFTVCDSFFLNESLLDNPNEILHNEKINLPTPNNKHSQENKEKTVSELKLIPQTQQTPKTKTQTQTKTKTKTKTKKQAKQQNLDPEILALRPKRKRTQLCTLDIEMTEYEKKQLRQLSKEELANLSKKDRLERKRIRDRISARNSRQRQKDYLKKLELRAQEILDEKNEVIEKFSELETENLKLKQEILRLKDLVLNTITNSNFIMFQRNTNDLNGDLQKHKQRRTTQNKQIQPLQMKYY
ncbi:basic-leucine zipper transcription factor f-related [Anaeramoeba flamelloides]|uniref:Basic-leucine zipper transcription factor f-related n=1 Tax=Anaeramoeba flamelloides TaxID=1746091 RepID=A0AAV7ZIV8_9EUKA|nr:basic-leucine zipper transcription factor f-related [Anaeramoeba flamelloides]